MYLGRASHDVMSGGDDPSAASGEGSDSGTVRFIYHNKLAPASPCPNDRLGQLSGLSRPSSRTNSQGHDRRETPEIRPGAREGVVTFQIRNSALDQIQTQSMEEMQVNSDTGSSELNFSDKPSYLNLRLESDQGSSATLLSSSINRFLDLPDHQIFNQLSRENMPQVVTYRPFIDTETGQKRYQEVAVTPSRGDIVETIRLLPRSSMIESLDLDHRYLSQSSPRESQLYTDLEIRPQSANKAYNPDPLADRPLTGLFRRSLARLRGVKFFKKRPSEGQEELIGADKKFIKKHRRIISAISVISHTERRARSLGFKNSKRDLKPFGFDNDFFSHQVDIHHFTYYAPAKNIFLRYCPASLQVQFIAMRSFTQTKPLPQTKLLYGSRAALQRNLEHTPGMTGGCILTDVSFKAKSCELSVILGGSGSGKTTLLDAIAHRLDGRGHPSGKILIDGLHASTSTVKQKLAYVIQHDRLLPNLTVMETLLFVAKLAYPNHDGPELKNKVSEVLDELGLMHVKKSRVGDGLVRGISGGERRRLSIACQLIKFTHILLLDEPTTGLDAFNAYNLMETLSRLSKKNIVVIATIHQPRSELFQFFDMVTLMSVGNVVYHGKRVDLIPYFTELGYPCPEFRNPLDHYIDVVSVDRYTKDNQEATEEKLRNLIQSYRRSQLYTTLMGELGNRNSESVSWIDEFSPCELTYKLGLLVHRMNVNVVRSFRACGMRSTVGLMFAIMLFGFILRLKNDQAGMQNRIGLLFQIVNGPTYFGIMNAVDLFPTLRDLFYRESMDGLYHPSLFILSYFLHVLPFTLFTSILFGSVGYWGMGFYPDAGRFIYFIAVFFILMLQGESIAVMILGLISDPVLANGVISLIMSMSITVGSGFIRNFKTLHPIFEFLSYGSMHRYASSTLAANEFGGLNFTCSSEVHCTYATGDKYLAQAYPNAVELKADNFSILASYCLILLLVCHILYSAIRIPRLR